METVILVNKKGRKLGLKEKIKAHLNPVPLHRAISVLVFNKGSLLIQKRSKNKKTWPLVWSNTCCSHPRLGESFQKGAERRLFEEMGIKLHLKRLFKFIYSAKFNRLWGEQEYDWVFQGEYRGKVCPDKKEVVEFRWVELAKLRKEVKNNPTKFTPWFKLILERI